MDATSLPPTRFCVLYRFKVRPAMEADFIDGWRRLTAAIRDLRGGLGSRLHRSEDGWWVAYAQWPDRATWQRAQAAEAPADADAAARMSAAIEERLPPLLLTPEIDLLEPCRGEAR